MEREQGAQRGQMVTVESSEVRRASQSDRQCVKEWRLWRKEQKGGKEESRAKRRRTQSNRTQRKKQKESQNGKGLLQLQN